MRSKLYADDVAAERRVSFMSGMVSLGVDDLTDAVKVALGLCRGRTRWMPTRWAATNCPQGSLPHRRLSDLGLRQACEIRYCYMAGDLVQEGEV